MASQRQRVIGWQPDTLLSDFEAATLTFPDDYDGPVTATLVRKLAPVPATRAFLYIHGFIDYFFQSHLAEQCNAHGYNFYALDMRKYGRSLGGAKHPNLCKDIREYYPEITASIEIITKDAGNSFLVLNGHSTGGLITALYAAEGPSRASINALFLNSPFFDFNVPPALKVIAPALAGIGRLFPFATLPGGVSNLYPMSLHKAHKGEWDFNLRLKPLEGFPTYLGWLRAIRIAQARARRGPSIPCPILVEHSHRSIYAKQWTDDLHSGDAVLNVAHIKEGSRHLGRNTTVQEINGGLHDLTLSAPPVRQQVFDKLFTWLSTLQ